MKKTKFKCLDRETSMLGMGEKACPQGLKIMDIMDEAVKEFGK